MDASTEVRLKQLEQLPEKIDRMNEILIRLEAKFSGGPGSWPMCLQHRETLMDMSNRLAKLERRFWFWSGGLIVVVALINIFAPIAQHIFKITKP